VLNFVDEEDIDDTLMEVFMNIEGFDFEGLERKWKSTIVARQKVGELTGGAVTPAMMAYHDRQKKGPKSGRYLGRKMVYDVRDLIQWLIDLNTKEVA
jgi:hypothetical protein